MFTIKKPDLKAPRFRPTRYNVLDDKLLNKFKKKFPQYKSVPDSKLREIIFTFDTLIWKNTINERDGVELPEQLGFIFVGTCPPPKKFNVDYKLSNSNITARHKNYESDNFLAKIFYTNYSNRYRFQNRELWEFKGIREFTRETSDNYPENWKKYIQIDNMSYISKLFKRREKSIYIQKDPVINEGYNEFDMN